MNFITFCFLFSFPFVLQWSFTLGDEGSTSNFQPCGNFSCLPENCLTKNNVSYCRGGRVVQSCANYPCRNGGLCKDAAVGVFVCECLPGWAGTICDKPVGEEPCNPDPCQGDCICIPSCKHEDGRYCVSNSGYIGRNCTIAVPDITCGPSEIALLVSQDFYLEFDKSLRNSYIYVSPTPDIDLFDESVPACEARLVGGFYRITIPLPFNDCGTSMVAAGDFISFWNRLWINRRIASGLFDMPVPVLDFQCSYKNEYKIVSSLMPVLHQDMGNVTTRTGTFSVDLQLCKIPACPLSCPSLYSVDGGAIYTVGEKIHVGVKADLVMSPNTIPSLVATVQEMFLSCFMDPAAPRVVNLASFGCPTQPGFALSISAGNVLSAQSACITFQLPRVPSCNEVYIHIRIRICEPEQLEPCPGTFAAERCVSPVKRSIGDSMGDDKASTIGPIYIIHGDKGSRAFKLYPEDVAVNFGNAWEIQPEVAVPNVTTLKNENIIPDTNLSWLLLAMGVAAVLISVGMLIWWQKRRNTSSGKKCTCTPPCHCKELDSGSK